MKRWVVFAWLLIAGSWLIAAGSFFVLPDRIPIHWNWEGKADGWADKSWAVWHWPAILTGLWLLLRALPWLSPKPFTLDTFRGVFDRVCVLMVVMILWFQLVVTWAAFDPARDPGRGILGGIFLTFALIGNLLGQVKRNFYVGVRTPWTLASEKVWNDTHRLSAWVFTAGGLAGCVLALVGAPVWIAVVLLLMVALVPVIYSLVYYKLLERRGAL